MTVKFTVIREDSAGHILAEGTLPSGCQAVVCLHNVAITIELTTPEINALELWRTDELTARLGQGGIQFTAVDTAARMIDLSINAVARGVLGMYTPELIEERLGTILAQFIR